MGPKKRSGKRRSPAKGTEIRLTYNSRDGSQSYVSPSLRQKYSSLPRSQRTKAMSSEADKISSALKSQPNVTPKQRGKAAANATIAMLQDRSTRRPRPNPKRKK